MVPGKNVEKGKNIGITPKRKNNRQNKKGT